VTVLVDFLFVGDFRRGLQTLSKRHKERKALDLTTAEIIYIFCLHPVTNEKKQLKI